MVGWYVVYVGVVDDWCYVVFVMVFEFDVV